MSNNSHIIGRVPASLPYINNNIDESLVNEFLLGVNFEAMNTESDVCRICLIMSQESINDYLKLTKNR